MLIPTIVIGLIAIAVLFIGYQKGGGEHILGLKSAGSLLLQIAPILILSFIVASMIQQLVPQEIISKWVGAESGLRGILIGTAMGAVMPGGPYVSLPVAAGIFRAGAGIGTMVAFIAAWSLISIGRLPVEIGILGWQFALMYRACTFIFAPIAGLIAHKLFSGVHIL